MYLNIADDGVKVWAGGLVAGGQWAGQSHDHGQTPALAVTNINWPFYP